MAVDKRRVLIRNVGWTVPSVVVLEQLGFLHNYFLEWRSLLAWCTQAVKASCKELSLYVLIYIYIYIYIYIILI